MTYVCEFPVWVEILRAYNGEFDLYNSHAQTEKNFPACAWARKKTRDNLPLPIFLVMRGRIEGSLSTVENLLQTSSCHAQKIVYDVKTKIMSHADAVKQPLNISCFSIFSVRI